MDRWTPYTAPEIRPQGWLRRQLEIQAEGLSGNLDKVWPDVRDSRWIGGDRDGTLPRVGARHVFYEQQSAGVRRVLRQRCACAARRGTAQREKRAREGGGRDCSEQGRRPCRSGMQERAQGEHRRGRREASPKAAEEGAFGCERANERAPSGIRMDRHAVTLRTAG